MGVLAKLRLNVKKGWSKGSQIFRREIELVSGLGKHGRPALICARASESLETTLRQGQTCTKYGILRAIRVRML